MRRTGHEHPGHWAAGRELRRGAIALLEAFPVRVRALAIILALLLTAVALLGQSILPVSAADGASTADIDSQATDASLVKLAGLLTERPMASAISEPPHSDEVLQPPPSNHVGLTCSLSTGTDNQRHPFVGKVFTIQFIVSGYTGNNAIFGEYKISRLRSNGTREYLSDGFTTPSSGERISSGTLTATVQGGLSDAGSYYFQCRLRGERIGPDENVRDWDSVYRNFQVRVPDTSPPDPPVLTAPASGERTTDRTPRLEWSVPNDQGGSGVAGYQVQISQNAAFPTPSYFGTSNANYTPDTLAYGTHYWRVKAIDASNNEGDWSSDRSFTVINPPTISSLGCSLPGTVYIGTSITCTPRLGGGTPSSYSWSASGGNPSSGTGSRFTTEFTVSGDRRIYLTVENNDGPVSRSELITVVNRAPRLSDRSPSGNLTGNSKLILGSNNSVSRNFSVDASDSDGNLSRVEWYVDDELEETDTLKSGTARFTARFTAIGTYTVEAIAYDDDESSDTERWRVRVEELEEITTNTPPTIDSYSPNERQISLSAGQMSRRFTVTVQDRDNDLKQINWVLEFPNGLEDVTSTLPNGGGAVAITDSYSRDFSSLSAGTYTVRAEITDQEGAEASRSWTVTVPGTGGDETISEFGNPWTDGTELLDSKRASSLGVDLPGVDPWPLDDTNVFVGIKRPTSNQSPSILKIRLERATIGLELANTLADKVWEVLAKLLGITKTELTNLSLEGLTGLIYGKAMGRFEEEDVPLVNPEPPEFTEEERSAAFDDWLDEAGLQPEKREQIKTLLFEPGSFFGKFDELASLISDHPILDDWFEEAGIPPEYREDLRVFLVKASIVGPAGAFIWESTASGAENHLKKYAKEALTQILIGVFKKTLLSNFAASDSIEELAEVVAGWIVDSPSGLTRERMARDLEGIELDKDLITDLSDVLFTSLAAAQISSAIPFLGAIASIVILDSALGFDGTGEVTVSVPKTAWIDYEDARVLAKRWWRSPGDGVQIGYNPMDEENQEAFQIAGAAAAYAVSHGKVHVLHLVGLVPILGDGASWAINLAIESAEFASDISYIVDEEIEGSKNSWLNPSSHNCTNKITIPWNLGIANTRGIEVQVPIYLSDNDYVSIYSDFTRSATRHVLLDVNLPFVRERGEFEIYDVLDTGRGENAPRCDLATFDAPPPPVLTSTPGITASPAALAVAEGGSASYSVVLDSRPSSSVRVSVNAPTRTDVRISPSSLNFTTSNWNTRQTVTVRALQDEDAAIDPFVTLAHTASGGGYTGTASENVVVVIEEDDVAAPSRAGPDLVVQSFSPSDATPEPSGRFTLSATVLNQGDEGAGSSTLRYYLSTDTHISTSDTVVGTDGVSSLAVSRTGNESLSLNASATVGTYYYGACVDAVAGEANTANNCSTVVAVTVAGQDPEEVITVSSEGDRGVLETLYNATDGPNWRAQRNWMSASPISSWQGVVVDANGDVTQLILAGYGLSGSIPPELGDLANLTQLHLSRNQLTGCVPAALRNVPSNDFTALGLPFCGAAPVTTGPQNGDRIFLDGGTLNGQPINAANPTLTVGAGQAISGTVNLTVHKDHSAAARFPVVATPTWGDHGRSYWRVPISAPAFGNADGTARINLTAPGSPGEYAIIFVAQAQTTGGHVASATHWPSGGPRWNNGDDVASWGSAAIDSAIRNGYVLAPQQGWTQANGHFGAAAIRVIVTAAPVRMEAPDLVVETSSPDDPDAGPREPFRFDATVRNQGDGEAASTTLRYYRSTDSTIDTSDTPIGTDPISRLPASGRSNESSTMYAQPGGTFYYGACVDAVLNESDTTNNCTSSVAVTVPSGPQNDNEAPVASGKTPSSPVSLTTGDMQSFSATATDADNNINSWEWFLDGVSQGGQSLALTGSTTRRFSHTFSSDGTYTVKVEFTDADGESTSDTWTVRVTDDTPVNRAPVVSGKTPSSPVSLTVGQLQALSVGVSDPDNNVDEWEWFLNGESRYTESMAPTGSFIWSSDYSFASPGTYTVTVTFTDSEGASASESWTVRVTDDEPDNEAPVFSTGTPSSPVSLTTGDSQSFSVTATDADNNINAWEWFLDGVSQGGQSLALTGSITRTFSHTFSSAGTYAVKVTFTDADGESVSFTWSVRVTSGSSGTPDLIVYLPSAPFDRTRDPGESFDMTFYVKNQGDGSSSGTASITYYRSSDSTISSSDTRVTLRSGTTGIGSMGAGRQNLETVSLTAHNSGVYYYGACVGTVANESDTTNNCGAILKVAISAPDLVIIRDSVNDDYVEAGEDFTFRATVHNDGTGDSPSTTLRYYRSADATITTSDTQVDTDSVGSLDPDDTDAESETITAPTTPGTSYYGVCVDTVTRESDTTNNCSTGILVTVTEAGLDAPDLTADTPVMTGFNGQRGDPVRLDYVVRNRGDESAGATTLRFYRSSDSTITSSDRELWTQDVAALNSNTSRSYAFLNWNVHNWVGTSYYGICVDAVTDESSTTNNCSSALVITTE